ncbi:AraC family transcriptional regulator [Paramixta manurensis]|uniref:AraC family transcriptional regulator n=1 Tax=Paramixta manurensis TaxID=2740817 RepID=A0A6M8UC34_9GAMM|nr:AraC family transcriptional regulator [Erwiniaceae bacterium PD-1]
MIYTSDHHDETRRLETADLRAQLAQRIGTLVGDNQQVVTSIAGLSLAHLYEPLPPMSWLYEPSISLIVQGAKRVALGESTYIYNESRFLLTAVNLPMMTEVLQASRQQPFTSLLLRFDLSLARQLIAELKLQGTVAHEQGPGLATGPATQDLLGAMARLVDLLDKPADIPHLGKLIQQEILYRILTGPTGALFCETVLSGTRSQRTAIAINWIRENFVAPLKMDELAKMAGMGVSTLHHHFRRMTAMSPLQYQKQLRLHEARRLLLSEDLDAATVAMRVGYESATQFNREYRRMFGVPPIRDREQLRSTLIRAR